MWPTSSPLLSNFSCDLIVTVSSVFLFLELFVYQWHRTLIKIRMFSNNVASICVKNLAEERLALSCSYTWFQDMEILAQNYGFLQNSDGT
jgi:hypothetical protein